MRSLHTFLAPFAVFALVALAACSGDPSPEPDPTTPAESDQLHEDDHEHGELYEPHTPEPGADAAAVADAFLAAFTAGGTTTATWYDGLDAYCFSSYCELLAQTDAAEIPTEAPTAPATAEVGDRPDAATATAPAEGGTWTVSLLATADGQWQVWDCTWSPS